MNVLSAVRSCVLDFLSDRKRSCAELSLQERQINCLQETLRAKHARELEISAENERLAPLESQRDGLMRELWLERRRNDEMRLDFGCRYQQLSAVTELLRTRVDHLEAALKQSEEARKDAIAGS